MIGGLGSLRGTAIAAVVVGLVQQYANYYASSGLGDLSVVLLLGIVLLARPGGLSGELRMRRVVDPGRRARRCSRSCRSSRSTSRTSSTARSTRPGTLQLLALCLLFGGLAITYDLLFGFTGLLSFGHALYFAVGVYVAAIAITQWHWSFSAAIAFTALVGVVLAARRSAPSRCASAGSHSRW